MQIRYSEYNTDSGSGTYDRLRQIARHRTASSKRATVEPLSIPQRDLTNLIFDLFRGFRSNAFIGLSERATRRIQKPGRWKEVSCSSLICEIVTDKLVRKGPLSDNGRLARCEQIQRAVERGSVRFAILLLPFRTPSPLKHRVGLPDLGEIYTLVLLESIAKACEHAQESMIAKARVVATSLSSAQLDSYGPREASFSPTNVNCDEIMAQAFAIVEAQSLSRAEAAKRKRCIRESLFNRKAHKIRDARSFAELLAALSKWSLSLEAFAAFRNGEVVPVSILAIQDAERYPCYSDLSHAVVAEYRSFLMKMTDLLDIERRHLDLVAYRDVAERTDETAQRRRDAFYENRLQALRAPIAAGLSRLLLCCGKEKFTQCLREVDADGIVGPLFEPLLLSVQHPRLAECALKWDREYEEVFFQCMTNIYDPSEDAELEQLRQHLIQRTLEAACQYCAAYEANTGLKNGDRFDDVSIRFPNTLRMSIHSKSESMGQFSISVSPTKTRTPWHGTAALSGSSDGAPIVLSIDLAGGLEATGKYAAVVVEAEDGSQRSGPFEGHAYCGQPIFYLSADLLSTDREGGPGAIWRELAFRGLRGFTQAAQ
ncbi:L-tyrosine/L-tryptophan isonitrile synthase family protein [Methylobacterium nodulans]|uniref:Uncharacterized protein n=1 Tax=Methylobacterium nodulans (strain LMG 21967 / CNCM I-2342 / ORS 2060) TaxID=460265 RepID=B8IXS5_METNO|nr:L-tyrosine/L-tryptophan isonitrile synthase family protein [Methylobacterium nodulans]ACL62907.1 hypothetical protein Mnod_7886 [Methylobacterium nodulans ORS 2060]